MDPSVLGLLASLQPAAQRYVLEARRRANLEALAKKRGSKMITLIHRQESMSLFGFPLVRYIDIDDAESILWASQDVRPGAGPDGQDDYHWVCAACFNDVRERFEWRVVAASE